MKKKKAQAQRNKRQQRQIKKNPQKDFKQSTTEICVKVGQKYKTKKGHFR